MLGKIVCGSGFEIIVFQSELCSTVSLVGVLSGLHYNRSSVIHNAITEAMEGLLLLSFFGETKIQLPESLVKISGEPELLFPNVQDKIARFRRRFQSCKQTIKDGKLGKTPQF